MKRFICVFILTVVFFTAKSTSFGTEKNGLEEVISAFGQEKENYGQALSGTNGLDNHMEFYAEVFFLYCHDRVKACDLYPVVSGLIESDLAALD